MENKKLSELLNNIVKSSKDLAKLKIQLAKVEAKEHVSENVEKAKNFIDDSVSNLKLNINENAKQYAPIVEERKKVLAEYRKQIEKICAENNRLREDCNLEILSCEASKKEKLKARKELYEQKAHLEENDPKISEQIEQLNEQISEMSNKAFSNSSKENVDSILEYADNIKPLIEQRDKLYSDRSKLDKVNEDLNKNEEEIEDIDMRIKRFTDTDKNLKDFLISELNDARVYKNDSLSIINEDHSFMKRLKGFFSSKILGAKGKCDKINEKVLKPFNEKVEKFAKDKLPEIIGNMTKKYEDTKDTIVDKSKQFICDSRKRAIVFGEKTKEKAGEIKDSFTDKLKEETNSFKNGVKNKFDMAIDFGRDVKLEIDTVIRDKALQISEKMNERIENTNSKLKQKEDVDELSI